MNQSKAVLSLAAVALLITGAVLHAGPLTPPVGPVASTGKTLTEIEPRIAISPTNTPGDNDSSPSLFKITQPGSYYLTGNIAGVVGKHGIEITTSGVTLDLCGFDLVGVPAMGFFDGVSVTVANLSNVTVINGSVRGWGSDGVDLGSFAVLNGRIEGVHGSGNVGTGVRGGNSFAVANCSANANTGFGIVVGGGSAVTNCTASSNTNTGLFSFTGCTITNCAAFSNGILGFSVSTGSTVTNCSAVSNTGNGFSVALACTVIDCSAYQNTGDGIVVTSGSTIADCTATFNSGDGIEVGSDCTVRGNTCDNNGNGTSDGAGIHATGNDNRIEGNQCTDADRGIDVDSIGNIIFRNTCAGNTPNWDIAANNYYGPIIDRTGVLTAAVNGPAAAGTLATSDPNANFSY